MCLNPVFKRSYELDAQFPYDFNLSIKIMDSGTFSEALIGETQIDLEDRYYGDLFQQEITALTIYKDRFLRKV
jgi:hypothetical protein